MNRQEKIIQRVQAQKLTAPISIYSKIAETISSPLFKVKNPTVFWTLLILWYPFCMILHFLGAKTTSGTYFMEELIPLKIRNPLFYFFGTVALLVLVGEMMPEWAIALKNLNKNPHYNLSLEHEKNNNMNAAVFEALEAVKEEPQNELYKKQLEEVQKHYQRLRKSYSIP